MQGFSKSLLVTLRAMRVPLGCLQQTLHKTAVIIVQRVSSTTVIIWGVLLVLLENLAMQQRNRLPRQHAMIVQPDDIPKRLALAMKVCVFSATLENIPTKLAI